MDNESSNRIYRLRRDLSPTNPWTAYLSKKAEISQKEKKPKIHTRQIKLKGTPTAI